jgi:non-heme chloroperoxidase
MSVVRSCVLEQSPMKLVANVRAVLLASCLAFAVSHAVSAQSTHDVKVVRAGDAELHYVEQGTGVPVIFVHGSVDDYRSFEPQLERLSQHYRVISYSRRYNFPNARSVPSGDHSALVEADDMANLLKALGAYPAHVVGHSYGAYTALILAMKHP